MACTRVPETGLSRRELLVLGGELVAAATLATGLGTQLAHAGEPAPAHDDLTPAKALADLMEGNKRFASGEILQPRRELERLRAVAEKQKPFAAVLGCADSRVPIEIVFDEGFGELFVVRVAGNIATPVEIASLEYAVAALGAKVIMVLGHMNCGAVKAALGGDAAPGQISTLYQYIVPAIDRSSHDLTAAVRANVQYQVRKLKEASPVIGAGIKENKVQVAGGVFDLTTGKVESVAA